MPPEATDTRMDRADVIRVERVRRRLKQGDVGKMAGLDQATVSRAELGRGSDEVYAAIAKALDVDLPEAPHEEASQ